MHPTTIPAIGEQDDHRAERRVPAQPELNRESTRVVADAGADVLDAAAVVREQHRRHQQLEPGDGHDEREVRRADRPPRQRARFIAAQLDQLDELHDHEHADEHDALPAHVEGDGGEDAEHHELSHRRPEHPAASGNAIEPPHEDGEGKGVGIFGQQLVGVAEQNRRGGQDSRDPECQQATGPAADDAVDEHEPGTEAGHLDELQVVVVEAPQVDERREQQRPAPRVGVRAEAPAGIDHREAVVGDDLSEVAVEDALGLAQIEREVVALGVAVAVQGDGEPGTHGNHDAESHPAGQPSAAASRTFLERRRSVWTRGDRGRLTH